MSETLDTTPAAVPPTQIAPERRAWPLGQTATITLFIAAIVIVTTAIVLLAGSPAPAAYTPGSPEAALQDYLRAWYDEDLEAAYAHFSASVQGRMSLADFEREAGYGYRSPDQSVELDRATGEGDTRTLHLTVVESYGGYGGGYEWQATVRMRFEGGAWKIDEPLVGLQEFYGLELP